MRFARYFTALLGLIGLSESATAVDHTKDTLETIKKAVSEKKAVLLDVREQSEWDEGHIKNAKHIPLSTLKGELKAENIAKVISKDTVIYCHCASGIRCLKAADALTKLGYDVRPMKPGYNEILKAGFEKAEK